MYEVAGVLIVSLICNILLFIAWRRAYKGDALREQLLAARQTLRGTKSYADIWFKKYCDVRRQLDETEKELASYKFVLPGKKEEV